MKIFNPSTGGHPLHNDDLLLLQTALKETLTGFFSFASASTDLILSGVVVVDNGTTVTCTSGFAFLNDEIFEVLSTSFEHSGGGTLYLNIIESTLSPSPVVYGDGTTKVAHINRQMQLTYYTSGMTGDYLSNFTRVSAQGVRTGTVIDWYGNVSANFDSTGYGINNMAGYGICNGNTYVGTATPDLRGKFIVAATNVPNTGAPALDGSLGTYNQSDQGGEKTHTLTGTEIPSHTHETHGSGTIPGVSGGLYLSRTNTGSYPTRYSGAGTDGLGGSATPDAGMLTGTAGSGGAHNNLPPYFA